MTLKPITSPQNSFYKEALKLQNPKDARKNNVFTVEGVRAVQEVFQAGWQIHSLWVEEGFDIENSLFDRMKERSSSGKANINALRADQGGQHAVQDSLDAAQGNPVNLQVYILPRQLFARLADTKSPQGILAIVYRKEWKLSGLLSKEAPLFVILEDLQDPGNAGTILRTADAAGADAVFVTKGTVDVFSQKVVRSSMGSLLHLPVITVPSAEELAPHLQKKGIRLYAGDLKAEKAPWQADLSQKTAILIGNEGAGLSEGAKKSADELIRIPMPGQAESLNAAIAAGMLLYEAVRQRSC